MIWSQSDFLNNKDVFKPFTPKKVSLNAQGLPVVSYGLSSMGYDLRISNDIRQIKRNELTDSLSDVKYFDSELLVELPVEVAADGSLYVILPPHSVVLAHSYEYIKMPKNTLGIAVGKSTYARAGILVNTTPLEPEWEGHLTIEITNMLGMNNVLYINEGICQILLFTGKETLGYGNGKYQYQAAEPVVAKMVSNK